MNQSTLHELLWQADAGEIGRVFREQVTILTREIFLDVMEGEVTALCGAVYHPVGRGCRRAGSAPGSVVLDGRAEPVLRPRVRRRKADGGEAEVGLASYGAARDAATVREGLLRAMAAGVSTRQARRVFPAAPGSSSSAVSRLWVTEGRKHFAAFRARDLSGEWWFGIVLDGIELAQGLTAVAAVGLTIDGRKVVLDLEVGASESREVCDRLLARLQQRKFRFGGTPLAVVDGSKALTNSLVHYFPDVLIQRCLVHKERNIRSCLSHRHYGELALLFNRLRAAEGEEAAREILTETHRFLASHSHKAVESLDEAGDDLITLHRLQAPSTLNVSLLSTNSIENIFRSSRLRLDRVTRWRAQSDQADRWLAYALGEAEKGFRRLSGWRDIPTLLERLQWPAPLVEKARQAITAVIAEQVKPRGRGAPGGPRARTCVPPTHVPLGPNSNPVHQPDLNSQNP
jgi:transposase-like protein